MMLALSEKCDNNGEMKIDGSIGDKKCESFLFSFLIWIWMRLTTNLNVDKDQIGIDGRKGVG